MSAPNRRSRIARPREQDIVVTVTTSKDPVLRGEWLRAGALSARSARTTAAARARRRRARARDLRVLRLARAGAPGVRRPDRAGCERRARLARGLRVAGSRRGRGCRDGSRRTTSSCSSRTGSPRGMSRSAAAALERRASAASAPSSRLTAASAPRADSTVSSPTARMMSARSRRRGLLRRRQPVAHVRVLEDVLERPSALVLTDDVGGDPVLLPRNARTGTRTDCGRHSPACPCAPYSC